MSGRGDTLRIHPHKAHVFSLPICHDLVQALCRGRHRDQWLAWRRWWKQLLQLSWRFNVALMCNRTYTKVTQQFDGPNVVWANGDDGCWALIEKFLHLNMSAKPDYFWACRHSTDSEYHDFLWRWPSPWNREWTAVAPTSTFERHWECGFALTNDWWQ